MEAADWADPFSDESNFVVRKKELQVAVGTLANSAVQSVKASLGDFTAVVGLVDMLENQVINMSWSSENSSECKAAVKYDEGTGQF